MELERKKGILTRYVNKRVNMEYYGRLQIIPDSAKLSDFEVLEDNGKAN